MFVGSKPNFEVLLTPIIKELKDIEYGVMIKHGDSCEKNIPFFLILGAFDKPARAAITNMKLASGFFGCIKCIQK